MRLDDCRLVIPPLWEHDWQQAIAEVDESERPLVVTQAELVRVLSMVKAARPEPSRLAWLMIWTRLFASCDAARGTWIGSSSIALEIVDRIQFEVMLHLMVLAEPWFDGNFDDLRRRLEGYAAWAMASDIKLLRSGVSHIDALFDPQPARDLVHKLAGNRNNWEERFGEIEIYGDAEAEQDKEEYRASAERKIARLENWLADPRLRPWSEKVLRRPGAVSLFEVFDQTERDVRSVMERLGFGYLYFSYQAGSGFVHGSTFQGFAWHSDDALMPLIGFPPKAENLLRLAEQIRLAVPILEGLGSHLA